MVERIVVSRDEVLHYPWLDHTWVYVYFPENSTTKNPLFPKMIEMFLGRGISGVLGKTFGGITVERDYIFIKYDTDDIIKILLNACAWILNRDWTAKNPSSPIGSFFTENKDLFTSFWREMKRMLEEKEYKYYFQSVDGMN